jgi:predicted amidohydrolase YtcJ
MGIDVGTDSTINRSELDKIAPNHPLLLEAFWGHVCYFNSAAIAALHLSETEPDVAGGKFERMKNSQVLNGRAFEEACNLLRRNKPTSDALFSESLKELAKQSLYFGITSIQNMCTGAIPEVFIRALKESPLPIRFRLIRWGQFRNDGRILIPAKNFTSDVRGLDLVRLSGTKWMLDGTPIERLAAVNTEYKDQPGWKGELDFTDEEVNRILNELSGRNEQPLFHAVGDHTIQYLLNKLEKHASSWTKKRVRIEHGDGLLPENFEQAKKLQVIIVQNPSHLTFVSMLHNRLPDNLAKNSENLKSILNAEIPLALGSDGPLNPYLNIMFAGMHPFRPEEALSREEAVIAYTRTSAYAEFADDKGILAPGKLADLVVLSQDIFSIPLQQLPATHSVLTMINGKIVFRDF